MKKMLFACLVAAGCSSSKPAPVESTAKPTVATSQAVAGAIATNTNAAAVSEPPAIPFGTKMKCPVSGEDFTVSPKTTQIVYAGKRYAFCCDDCLPEFNKNPAKFALK